MKKIYFILPLVIIILSGCSSPLFNKDSDETAKVENVVEVNQAYPEVYPEDKVEIAERPEASQGIITIETINSEKPYGLQVVIKNNDIEIFRFPNEVDSFTDIEASLISRSGNNIYFYTALTGFGGCIYAEYNVKTFYKFNLDSLKLEKIADKVSYISLTDDFSFAGYVQDEFYVLKDLNSGLEKRLPFPNNAPIYRNWLLSPDGRQVSMTGYVGESGSGCFWDDKSPVAEETYVWNLTTNVVNKVSSGPVGL